MCPGKVLEKSMPHTTDSSSKNDMYNHVYHGLPNGTLFAAREDNRGTSYHPDPVCMRLQKFAGWLVCLFGTQTSTWSHFLNQPYLLPPLSLKENYSDWRCANCLTTTYRHVVEAAAAAGGADRLLRLTNGSHSAYLAGLSYTFTKPSGRQAWPAPYSLVKRLGMICHKVLLANANLCRAFCWALAKNCIGISLANDVL